MAPLTVTTIDYVRDGTSRHWHRAANLTIATCWGSCRCPDQIHRSSGHRTAVSVGRGQCMTLFEEVMGSTLTFAGVMMLEEAEPSHACQLLHRKWCVESMWDLAVWEEFETGKELTWGGFEAVGSWGGGCSPPGSWPHAASTFDARTCLLQWEGEGEGEKTKKVSCVLQEGEEEEWTLPVREGEKRNAMHEKKWCAWARLRLRLAT
jgi:hypothetical protein